MKRIKALVEIDSKGKILAIASDESKDRQGDVIKQTDWDLTNFRKNPVLLLSHKYDLPPIGVVENIKISGKTMTFEPRFHEITQQAREIKQLYLDGIMRAFSVGFMDSENGKNQLLEISAVSVPANANALVMSKSISDDEQTQINDWLDSIVSESKSINEKENLEKMVEEKVSEIKEQIININTKLNSIAKSKDRQVNQGDNASALLAKGLEKLSNQLGYIQRKVK